MRSHQNNKKAKTSREQFARRASTLGYSGTIANMLCENCGVQCAIDVINAGQDDVCKNNQHKTPHRQNKAGVYQMSLKQQFKEPN